MGYTKIAVKGVSWLAGIRVITRVISVVRTAIIARLLTPSDFGFFAIASLVLTFIELLTETGINIVLMQKKEQIDKYIDTAWITSIIRGAIICLIILVSAQYIASFFETPEAYNLLLLISLVPLIRGFINPSVVKFVKDLQFNKEFAYRITIFVVESAVAIVWAYFHPTAISLVMGLVAGAMVEVVVSFLIAKPIPRVRFEKIKFFEIIHKGKWLTLNGILNYGYRSGDDIVVGKILGASSLGLYDVAYRFSMLPITEVADVIGKATFPVYVRISDDLERLKRAYFKSIFFIFIIAFPICVALVLFPELLIRITLGEQWIEASQILQVLAVVGLLRATTSSIIAPLYALNMQKNMAIMTAITVIGMLISIIPLTYNYGLVGAAFAPLIGTLMSIPYGLYLIKNIFRGK